MPIVHNIPELPADGANAATFGSDNSKWLTDLFKNHEAWLISDKVDTVQKMYDGHIESVATRDKNRGDGINNKLMSSYAAIVVDTLVDYMLGKAVTWTITDPTKEATADDTELEKEYRTKFLKVANSTEACRTLVEQLRHGCISGYGTMITWINEKGGISFNDYPVQEVVPIYNARGEIKAVLRKYLVEYEDESGKVKITKLEVYDEKYVTYLADSGDGYVLDPDENDTGNPYVHRAQGLPVTVFRNGIPADYSKRSQMAGTSDIIPIMTEIEDYANKLSDKANLVEYLMDQYLLLVGVDTDEDEVIKMRKARALVLKGDKNISSASFISQTQDDKTVENHLDRTKATIYEKAFIPQLGSTSGATATEIKLKMASLDIKANKKEAYLLPVLTSFGDIVVDMLNVIEQAGDTKDVDSVDDDFGDEESTTTVKFDKNWLSVALNRNSVKDHGDIANIVQKLSGIVPDVLLYELLWFVDDPKTALEEMKKQNEQKAKEAMAASIGFGSEFNSTDLTDEQKAAQAAAAAAAEA